VFLQKIKKVFPGQPALLEYSQKSAFRQVAVERNDGFETLILEAYVASFLPHDLEACLLQ
jgi:hypothetical protein